MISWPQAIDCHGDVSCGGVFRYGQPEWRAPEDSTNNGPYYYDFRRCSYCGSMHPEDLVAALRAGARLHGADWKYGWPHKFYVEGVPNKSAGTLRNMGGFSGGVGQELDAVKREHPRMVNWRASKHGGWEADLIEPAPAFTPAKFYNEHILDLKEHTEALELVSNAVFVHTGVRFEIHAGRLAYAVRKGVMRGG